MKLLSCRFVALIAFVLAASAGVAHADLFTFNISGVGQSASGFLNANATGNLGQYQITSITGTLTGVTIAGLVPVNGYNGNDNLLVTSTSGSLIPDGRGFSLALVDGINVNVFTFVGLPFNGLQFLTRSDAPNAAVLMSTFQITPVPVPELSSLALLGTGLAGITQIVRQRRFSRA